MSKVVQRTWKAVWFRKNRKGWHLITQQSAYEISRRKKHILKKKQIGFDSSCELPFVEMIHLKYQAWFSGEWGLKKIK